MAVARGVAAAGTTVAALGFTGIASIAALCAEHIGKGGGAAPGPHAAASAHRDAVSLSRGKGLILGCFGVAAATAGQRAATAAATAATIASVELLAVFKRNY